MRLAFVKLSRVSKLLSPYSYLADAEFVTLTATDKVDEVMLGWLSESLEAAQTLGDESCTHLARAMVAKRPQLADSVIGNGETDVKNLHSVVFDENEIGLHRRTNTSIPPPNRSLDIGWDSMLDVELIIRVHF